MLEQADDVAPRVYRGHTLWDFQRAAINALNAKRNVIVAAPTGSGKTLVAEWAIEEVLKRKRRAVYASPVKALSNQKHREFSKSFGPEAVGLVTGDVTINPTAPIVVMTTEIFRNNIIEAPGSQQFVQLVVLDEIHYLDDESRGTIWEESVIFAPAHMQVVALSATIPNAQDIAAWMHATRGREVEVVSETKRPIPLYHAFWVPRPDGDGYRSATRAEVPAEILAAPNSRPRLPQPNQRKPWADAASDQLVEHLAVNGWLPALYFCPSTSECERLALRHAEARGLFEPDSAEEALRRFDELCRRYKVELTASTSELRAIVPRGVAYHHGAMMPSHKLVVEELFSQGVIRLLFATSTFATGVNMPARSVSFHSLAWTKPSGRERSARGSHAGRGAKPRWVVPKLLLVREYAQMAGRAGRQGIDKEGRVFSVLGRREVTAGQLERFELGEVEPIRSHFNPSYRILLYLRYENGFSVDQIGDLSFARYQGDSPGADRLRIARVIAARFNFLERFGYIDEQGLTTKGRVCSRINAYEIQAAEAYDRKWIANSDPIQIAALFGSIACDRSIVLRERRPRSLSDSLRTNALQLFEKLLDFEREAGLPDPLREPNFDFDALASDWARGDSLHDTLRPSNLGVGHFVRIMRMAIQGIWCMQAALPPGDPCRSGLREAAMRLKRDEVDARHQLPAPSTPADKNTLNP